MNYCRYILFSLLLLLMAAPAFSQDNYDTSGFTNRQKRHIRRGYYPPGFLLVMLPTGNSRMTYFQKIHDTKRIRLLTDDLQHIQANMVSDFNENFKYCPVYYFYDTNSHYISEGRYSGVLLDSQLHPVINPPKANDTSFFIGFYGTMGVESIDMDSATVSAVSIDPERNPQEDKYLKSRNTRSGHGWYVMNWKFKHLKAPLPIDINDAGYLSLSREERRRIMKYRYRSRNFTDIDYDASAAAYSNTLLIFYGTNRNVQ